MDITSKEALELLELILLNHSSMLVINDKRFEYFNIIKDRLEALEKENKELNDVIEKYNHLNIQSFFIRDREREEIKQLKKAIEIFKKIISIPLEDDFAKVKIDKETKEETHYYALSIKYLIDEQEYELLKEVLGDAEVVINNE